ncbi:MAG: PTS sugar transporter subunit IIA [Candidatus Omnitrophica bacterium]|nr:PTS sugar transporter subunit IIA [Candidatus Omnitrophota bacterium]
MKLTDLIQLDTISVDLEADKKEGVISEMVDLLVNSGNIKKKDRDEILEKVKEREQLGSTGIGKGIGIPHAKTSVTKKMVAAIGISKKGVDFKSLDGEPTYIFFLLAAPGDNPGPHLKVLSRISRLLDDKFIRERLRAAKNGKEILGIIRDEEQKNTLII